jgi:transcriptional regulator with XRE-family HTH domain
MSTTKLQNYRNIVASMLTSRENMDIIRAISCILGGLPVFGQKLRELRKIEGWTQEEVAKKLGISKQTYSHYENENRKPSLDTIKQLAIVYGVDIDEIFADEPQKTKALNPKEERDIALELERILNDLESQEALAFHGEPLDDEDRELLRRSLENSLIVARQMAKKKFTPKKYRK